MRTSRFLLATVKETPADAEIISHQLMIRAGLIRRVAAGIYNWLPLGLRVLRKVENVVRQEMDNAGAQEILMPGVQPAELWKESGRWEAYGPELLRFTDRHQREFCLGPTHEEVVTNIVGNTVHSYRQLPMNLYQIQWKFRDEIRPRFGVMRGREFLMKDAYSFDIDEDGMRESYKLMYQAYENIFSRIGLESRAVAADSGAIGGDHSHEFHVLADSGEDAIGISSTTGDAVNVEVMSVSPPSQARPPAAQTMTTVDTPGVHTIDELCKATKHPIEATLKTLIVRGVDGPVALLLRGDHELNTIKAEKLDLIAEPLQMASSAEVLEATGVEPGSIGPVGLKLPIVADNWVLAQADFICGANVADKHLSGVNWERDLPVPQSCDLRMVTEGEPFVISTDDNTSAPDYGTVQIRRGIEVGHVFQLGLKYSESLNASIVNQQGKNQPVYMGCYGVGVSRIVAAAIEQNHDESGILWPSAIAPFHVCIVPIGIHKSQEVRDACDKVEQGLSQLGIECLLDDRNERPGVMFADMDLIGIPHRVVIGAKSLERGVVEYRKRGDSDSEDVPIDEIVSRLKQSLA